MASLSTAQAPTSLANLFKPSEDSCQRCLARVYQVEKVGPVNEVIFHKHCFKCTTCQQHLTLRTYFTNQEDINDKEIYCGNHAPKTAMHGYDGRSVGMQHAMRAPRAVQSHELNRSAGQAPKFGSDALFIKNPMMAQGQYQNKYKTKYDKHQYPAYVVSKTKESLYKHQEELERKQREEEDRLLSEFEAERKEEAERLKKEYEQEWEISLQQLAEKFEVKTAKKNKKGEFESEKNELMKNLTVKMKKKKDAMTIRLTKEEQEKTAELVTKQSGEMLELMRSKQDDLRREMLENMNANPGELSGKEEELNAAMAAISLPLNVPAPHPPRCRKRDLYTDPSVFAELDEDVIRVAESEQSTFTELVKNLTEHCLSDLQKARAIFRWITVKDLNVMEFDELVDSDTPLGLLRGIKFGTETYHTLFMRLCSYAGLACVEIKGHSKSVGYEPGMKIREDTFQNTWNAVLIDGDWWPVQCNWGARHLVLNKDVENNKPVKSKKQDKIRYQYDEHYFLTDPDEFIQEFWAQDISWQLLGHDVTLEEFESMPFVRSVFFHYGLDFEKVMKAVVNTDQKGGSEVKIRVPTEFARDLVFHYQIRFADRERRHETEFRGAKLERFVFHSLQDGYALFSVHVPAPSAYFLEIFANKIDESNKIGDDPNATMMPFRLKCACKFKIVCDELVGKMHPLPNCASGEWGPSKGQRHFGLRPVTHDKGVINVDNDSEIRFNLPRPLHFLCKLRMNGVEDSLLEKHVSHSVFDDVFTVRVRPPQPGQYGLDIYARPEDAADNHTLAHACKYLLNCTRVNDPIDLPVSKVEPSAKMSKEKWGPASSFAELGMKTLSHPESTIEKTDPGPINIEIELTQSLKLSYHLILEPTEDLRKEVTMKDSSKKVKFTISTPKSGNYLFAIYARKKKDSENNMFNVYNYMIRYRPKEKDSTLKSKKKGLFK